MKRIYSWLLCLSALAVAYFYIVGHESDFLKLVEEQGLFLPTSLFLKQQTAVAGGALCYVGTWLTEFLYQPWLGALLFCAACGLLMFLVSRTFRVPVLWSPLLLVPLAALLLSNFSLGYWVYVLKMPGFFFAGVVGFSLAVAGTWVYRLCRPWWLRWVFMVIAAVLLYPLAGFYGLLAVALMGLSDWRFSSDQWPRKAAATVLAALLVVAVPLLCYRFVYSQMAIGDLWRQALPLFEQSDHQFPVYQTPYIVVSLLLCLLAVIPLPSFEAKKRLWLWAVAHVVVVAAIVYCVNHYWYRDDNFHIEMQMHAAIENNDWEEVLGLAATADEPTRLIVMYKYLAVFKLGRAGEDLYNLRDGDSRPNTCVSVPLVQLGGRPIYLHYGVQNFCYRWCVEDGVEYGWRVDYLKYMMRCALLNGEWQLARKFIDLLKMTRYHGEWAAHYEPMIGHPELVKKDPELGPITHVLGKHSMLASDKSMLENFLITLLAGITTDDPVGADLAVMSALQTKDIPTFWRAFFQYANLHVGKRMPRLYQEAAFLYGTLEHQVDISNMPFDKEIAQNYQAFMQAAQQCQGMGNDQMKASLYPRFGNTFFYNYFLIRNMKTY